MTDREPQPLPRSTGYGEFSSNVFGRLPFWGFLITSPLIVYGIHLPVANLRFARLFILLVIFLYIVFVVLRPFARLGVKITTFEIVVAFVSIYALLGILWSDEALWGKRFWGWIECIAIYFSVLWFCQHKRALEIAIRIYILSVFFVLYVCFWQFSNALAGNIDLVAVPFSQFAILDFYDRLHSSGAFGIAGNVTRLSGPFNDPNMLAGYLGSLLCMLTISMSSRRTITISNVTYYTFFFVTAAALLLTFSKSGLIAMTLGILIIISQGRLSGELRLIIVSLFLVAGTMVLLVFPEMITVRIEAADSGHIQYLEEVLTDISKSAIGELLRGGGFGIASTHRLVTTLFAELGIVGILLWTVMTLFPYQLYKRVFISIRRKEDASMGLGLLGAVVCIAVGVNLYDYMMYPFVWIIFGFGGAFLRLKKNKIAPKS